jgi:hypothetical protein
MPLNVSPTIHAPITPSKSAIVQLHNKRNPQSTLLTLNSVVIQEQQHIKYLDLTLEQKLTFRLHIENVRIKCASYKGYSICLGVAMKKL